MTDNAAQTSPRDHVARFLHDLERPDGRLMVSGETWSASYGDSKRFIAEAVRQFLARTQPVRLRAQYLIETIIPPSSLGPEADGNAVANVALRIAQGLYMAGLLANDETLEREKDK